MNQPGEDKRLMDYLLGNLPEAEEIRLEEEYLADSDAQDRLAAIEDDLVDAYLQRQLSSREREQLEARFLASPRGRRKLALAKSLMALAGEQRTVQELKAFPFYRMRWAMTAAALLLILAVGWWIRVKMIQSPPSQQTASQPNGASGHTGPAVAPPTQTPVPGHNPNIGPAVAASIILSPVARNTEQPARLIIRQGASNVEIQLDLETNHHKSYRATLLGTGEEPKWSTRHLKAKSTNSGKAVVLSLPATTLPEGAYTILLAPDEDDSTPIAEYAFVVQRK